MAAGIRRSWLLRLLVAAVFAPILIVTQTGVERAAAADAPSGPTAKSFGLRVERSGAIDLSCTGTLDFGGHGTWNVFGGRCTGGVNTSGWMNVPPEAGTEFMLTLQAPGGGICDSYTGDFTKPTDSSPWKSEGNFEGFGTIGDCSTESTVDLCLAVDASGITGAGQGCASITVPRLDMSCLGGDASIKPPQGESPQVSEHGGFQVPRYMWFQNWRIQLTAPAGFKWEAYTITGNDPTVAGWQTGTNLVIPFDGSAVKRNWVEHTPSGIATDVYVVAPRGPRTSAGDTPASAKGPLGAVRGFGLYLRPEGSSLSQNQALGGVSYLARTGVNNPAQCSFYWGDQIWDDGNPLGGPDVPAGGLADPPGEDVPTPEPTPIPDKDSWWESAWSILKDIANAILNLPRKVGEVFKSLLTDLFVPKKWPDWGSIDPPVPPGWTPDFPSVHTGECGPLTMPSVDLGMVRHVESAEFVNTCDEPWVTVRTFTYYGLLALVLLMVGNRLFRAVMSGLGMAVDSPTGAGEDE